MFLVFWATQAIPGTINTTPNGPSINNNFITPPRIEDAAIEVIQMQQRLLTEDATCLHIKCNLFTSKLSFWQNNEPVSVLTIETLVDEGTTMTTKTSATRTLFQKKNGSNGSLNYVSTQQLLRTRNQKKKQQV